jgi:hypothetical protein
MSWKRELAEVFANRTELSASELVDLFGARPVDGDVLVEECLRLFEQEYGLPIGLLRPDDPLRLFTNPPHTANPIASFFRRMAFEDSTSELNYRLKLRRRALGSINPKTPTTIGEYAAAFLGYEP